MNRLTTTLRRVCAALLLCLAFPTTLVHAQFLNFRIDAPKDIDSETIRQDIGTLKITFSNSNAFQDVKNYEERYLNLSDEFQWADGSSSSRIRYRSFDLYLNCDADGKSAYWYANSSTQFSVRGIQSYLSLGSDKTIYYRVYSPHFNRVITGEITPSDENAINIRYSELEKGRRVAFQPVIGREGNAVSARFAPDLRTGTCNGGRPLNMYDLTEPFAVYAATGDTLRYLVYPTEDNLALHVDSLVVTDTTTCVTTDYRKATLCYFYITDTKGNLCPADGTLSSVYYPEKTVSDKLSNGYYGYGFYNIFGCRFNLTSPDGTMAAYALPGTQTFQFSRPTVKTTDPDFLMPYNGQNHYVIKQVTIPASTEPVKISLGESNPLRVVTTLADAAPYADHLSLGAVSYVSRPYAWGDNVDIDIMSREVSRQVNGNDIVITTLVEGSTAKPSLKLTANFGAQSDTVPRGINSECKINDNEVPPLMNGKEYHFTQKSFVLDGKAYRNLDFSVLHPVKFVIPCHLMQEGYQLISDFPLDFVATHHKGCEKSLAVGSESPVPYDTITVILPEEKELSYRWYMQKGSVIPDHKYDFLLDATGPLEQRLPDSHFSILRVNNLGVDSIYVYNDVPEYKMFRFNKNNGSNEAPQIYYAAEPIHLHAGYNEHVIKYRQIKIEKDTFNMVRFWVEIPHFLKDEEGNLHPSYTSYALNTQSYEMLNRWDTITPDNAINISTGSKANLAVTQGTNYGPAYLAEIAPSDADTIVSIYKSKAVRTRFTFNGGVVPAFLWLNMCFNNNLTHVAPAYWFNRGRFSMDLLPGHYIVEGVATIENAETGDYDEVPFNAEFDVPSSDYVELNPSATGITPPVTTDGNGTLQEQARYTIDGRRIDTPQRGVNIIKMNDGTVRKVIVK